MNSENRTGEMTIENLNLKLNSQKKFIDQLTAENEELFHQFNHLMIRNTKLLKRVDDLQNIIDDLHIRIEELQIINSNMLRLNDTLRQRTDMAITGKSFSPEQKKEDRHDMKYFTRLENIKDPADAFDLDRLFDKWKNYPGQEASNSPNLRKQVLMLVHLYNNKQLRANELFQLTGVGGVTGARYVSSLKKFRLITYTGARKKGHYEIAPKGKELIESVVSLREEPKTMSAMESASGRGIQAKYPVPAPGERQLNKDDL